MIFFHQPPSPQQVFVNGPLFQVFKVPAKYLEMHEKISVNILLKKVNALAYSITTGT